MLCLCYKCYKKIYNNNITVETAEMSAIKLICQCCGKKRNIVVNVRKGDTVLKNAIFYDWKCGYKYVKTQYIVFEKEFKKFLKKV